MDYIDAAMTGTLSPDILPIMDLKKMLSHIEETLLSTLHLPVSSEYILHFYQYLCTHVFNHQQAIPASYRCTNSGSITTTFHLQNLYFDFYDYGINTQYLRFTQDETMAVEISPQQFKICQEKNGQFCTIPTPFQPLTIPPS